MLGREASATSTYDLRGGNIFVNDTILGIGDPAISEPGAPSIAFLQSGGNLSTGRLMFGSSEPDANSYSATYALSAGQLQVNGDETNISGIFLQSGGDHTVQQDLALNGNFLMEGGVLQIGVLAPGETGNLNIGFGGSFAQSDTSSRVSIYRALNLAGGVYSLHSGLLEVGTGAGVGAHLNVDAFGRFEQDGGNLIASNLSVRPSSGGPGLWGQYTMDGGNLSVAGITTIHNNGTFLMAGGTFESGELDNSGHFNWNGGEMSRIQFNNQSDGVFSLNVGGPHILDLLRNQGRVEIHTSMDLMGFIHNQATGIIKLYDGVVAEFVGFFRNDGRIEFDPATAVFQDGLSNSETGYMVAGAGDTIVASADFLNNSQQSELWHTELATLVFQGEGLHTLALPGEDNGSDPSAFLNNFAWGALRIESGAEIQFTDGNQSNNGTALYVGVLDIVDPTSFIDVQNLIFTGFIGDANLYYDPNLQANAYLGGLSYRFASGSGWLTPVIVPLPPALPMFCLGLLGLVTLNKRVSNTRCRNSI